MVKLDTASLSSSGTDTTIIAGPGLTQSLSSEIKTLKADTSLLATKYKVQQDSITLTAAKQNTVSLTTTGSSGAATFNSSTGALNIPNYVTPQGNLTGDATSTGLATTYNNIVPINKGGTGTTTPGIVAGTNVTVTGSWPNQTINASGGGSGTDTTINAGWGLIKSTSAKTNTYRVDSTLLLPIVDSGNKYVTPTQLATKQNTPLQREPIRQ